MNRSIPSSRCALALVAAALGSSAAGLPVRTALAAESLPAGFRACAERKDRDERLACFDAEVARLTSPAVKEQNFGAQTGELARQKATQKDDEFREIAAQVASVAVRPRGELVVTLDNGQVWSQTEAGKQFTVRAGDSVRIKTGAMSAYLLIAPSGRVTRVTRTK